MYAQCSLFGLVDPGVDDRFVAAERTALDETSWIEFVPGWLHGDQVVFDELVDRLRFRQRRDVVMFDSVVDEPRLTAWWAATSGPEPLEALAAARTALSARYGRCFDSIGFNLYRDGSDSVAWHGDRHRHHVADPIVAIVSLGAARPFRLRPLGGGRSRSWELGHGDLLVMGGACQHDWQHAVPKVTRAVGPRLSVTYRHGAGAP